MLLGLLGKKVHQCSASVPSRVPDPQSELPPPFNLNRSISDTRGAKYVQARVQSDVTLVLLVVLLNSVLAEADSCIRTNRFERSA